MSQVLCEVWSSNGQFTLGDWRCVLKNGTLYLNLCGHWTKNSYMDWKYGILQDSLFLILFAAILMGVITYMHSSHPCSFALNFKVTGDGNIIFVSNGFIPARIFCYCPLGYRNEIIKLASSLKKCPFARTSQYTACSVRLQKLEYYKGCTVN